MDSKRRTQVFVNDLKKYTPPRTTQAVHAQATAQNSTVVDDEFVGRGVGARAGHWKGSGLSTAPPATPGAAPSRARTRARTSAAPPTTAGASSNILPPRRRGRPAKLSHLQGRVRGSLNLDGSNAISSRGQGQTTDGGALGLSGGRGREDAHPIATSEAAANRPRTRPWPTTPATAPAPAGPATASRRGRGRPRKAQL